LTFRWRDQGRGNRKGRVWVVGRHRHAPIVPDQRFQGGRIVCESPVAPHDTEDCKMTFLTSAMEGELYQLWYRVGGGGGHQLMLLEGRLHTVIFDDEQGNVSRNYEILKNSGVIGVHPELIPPTPAPTFYPQLLLRVSQSLRSQLANQQDSTIPLDDSLAAFFRMFMIPVTEGSLLALEEIIQCNLDEQASIPVPPPQVATEEAQDEEEDDFGNFFWGGRLMRLAQNRQRNADDAMVWQINVGNFGANINLFDDDSDDDSDSAAD
jgi:hypothetical protein